MKNKISKEQEPTFKQALKELKKEGYDFGYQEAIKEILQMIDEVFIYENSLKDRTGSLIYHHKNIVPLLKSKISQLNSPQTKPENTSLTAKSGDLATIPKNLDKTADTRKGCGKRIGYFGTPTGEFDGHVYCEKSHLCPECQARKEKHD